MKCKCLLNSITYMQISLGYYHKLLDFHRWIVYKLVPDLKVLTNVLLQLSSIKEVDFAAIRNQKGKTVFNPSEAFDIKFCVLELLNRDRNYNAISRLKILILVWIRL